MTSTRSRKRLTLSTLSLTSFQSVAFETAPLFVWLMMALSRPFKNDRSVLSLSTVLFSGQSLAWCPWLCASKVLPQLPQQIFWNASRFWWFLCQPVYLLSRFPWHRHVQDSTPKGVFDGRCWTFSHAGLGFPFPVFTFCSMLIELLKLNMTWPNRTEASDKRW